MQRNSELIENYQIKFCDKVITYYSCIGKKIVETIKEKYKEIK